MRSIVEIFFRFAAAASLTLVIGHPAPTADTFRKLNESEIRAKLAEKEITDDIHFGYQYMRDGTIKIFSMGEKATGTWRVKNGQLCVEARPQDTDCYGVWLSGNKVQFRFSDGALLTEGHVQKQTPRE